MEILWYGHSCFRLRTRGAIVVTDPCGKGVGYNVPKMRADIVTISHNHFDHNNAAAVQGDPKVIKEAGVREVRGITFRGIMSAHGFMRGPNIIFCFEVDGVRLCHLGDLARVLTEQQVEEIGEVDVLFIPVGGLTTINAPKARQVCEQLSPLVAIPMQFGNSKCRLPFAPVDAFLKGKGMEGYRRLETSEMELTQDTLPEEMEVVVLEPAL